MRRLTVAIVAACVLVLAPALASADILLTPFAGVSNINDAKKGTFGAALGFGSLIGLEFEAARIQLGTFDDIPVVDLSAHATTFMGNFVIRLPTGAVQPYGTAGVGLMRVTGEINAPIVGNVVSVSARDYAWNIGGGLYIFPTPNFGVRGDIRHFRTGDVSFTDLIDIGGINDLPLPELDFWRATVGITLKF